MATPKQATETQYQAQNLSMDFLATTNRALEYQSQMFKDLLKEGRYTQERSAQESAKQRTSDETRSLYGANAQVNSSVAQAQGQVGAASENSRANVMNAQLARDQYSQQVNASMGLDAKGNVLATPISNGGGNVVQTRGDSMFGKYGVSALQTSGDMGDGARNAQNIRDYDFQRGQAVTTTRMMEQAMAAGDIARTKAQGEQQRDLVFAQSNADAQRMNREAALKSNADASARAFQSREADKDRINQRYLAGVDANSRLFASLTQGQGGFQYWGGSI
jgi:hypothetical protein